MQSQSPAHPAHTAFAAASQPVIVAASPAQLAAALNEATAERQTGRRHTASAKKASAKAGVAAKDVADSAHRREIATSVTPSTLNSDAQRHLAAAVIAFKKAVAVLRVVKAGNPVDQAIIDENLVRVQHV
jgi:hypothetical protein